MAYFKDKNGLLWRQEQEGFRNVGVTVKESLVTFKKVDSIKVLPSPVIVPTLSDAIPVTVREAINQLHITELTPLEPLKNLLDMEV